MSRLSHGGLFMIAWVLTGLGWLWSSSVWDQVWVERSEGFFPPEWRTEREIAQLNGHAPLFRENDTYYWIYLTREAFLENGDWGKTRLDGLGGSRPVHWSPILPGIILTSAKIRATATSDSFLDAIHWAGHWLNPWIGWIGCGLIGWLALIGFRSSHAIFVLLLLFFHPALQWVFSPSRLDHHSLQVVVFGIQTVCICIALERTNVRRLLATGALWGFSSALGLSLSATPQLAISGGITFILFLLVLLHPRSASFLSEKRPFFLSYAAFGGGFTFVLWLIIGSVPWDNADITVLHPIHAIAIIGSGLFLAGLSTTGHSRQIHWKYCGAGLLCGIAPILWILPNPSNGHIWFQSFIPKMHVFIWDYKGAVSEGDWVNPSLWTSIFLLAVAALGFRKTSNRFLIATGILFLALGLWQQRWLNEAAVVAALALGLCVFRKSTWIVTLAIMGCGFLWLHKWVTIEQKPGIQFSADLLLRTLGRDIALNLEKEASGEPLAVAMVYDFAPQALPFEMVHPIGSLYWENQKSVQEMADFFSETDAQKAYEKALNLEIDYVVVQPQGRRFALMNQLMSSSDEDLNINSTLAMRLSTGLRVPAGFIPVRFSGTFDPRRVDARIYRVAEDAKPKSTE